MIENSRKGVKRGLEGRTYPRTPFQVSVPRPSIIWKNNLNMLQEHYLNAYCSRSIFATCSWSSVHFKYDPGAYLTLNSPPDY